MNLNLGYLAVGFMVVFFLCMVSLLYGVHGYSQNAVIYHNFFASWIIISVLLGLMAVILAFFFASAADLGESLKRPYYGSSSSSSDDDEDEEDPNEF